MPRQGPLFYQRPVPLDRNRHSKFGVKPTEGYAFAAKTNSVAINAIEFPQIAKFYPIVFSANDPAMPVAVLGLENQRNAMVNGEGEWRNGAYIPAYIRRYPFIFFEDRGNDRLTLCIDEGSGYVVEGGGEPLFDEAGEPTDYTSRALQFCTAYQRQHAATRAMGEALSARGMLVERVAALQQGGESGQRVGGFRIIDPEKMNELDDETFLDWRRKGWLPLIYAHMMSASNWPSLAIES